MNALAQDICTPLDGAPRGALSAELEFLFSAVRDACPPTAVISLSFDGRLNLLIDVQSHQEAATVEAILPTLANGAFTQIHRSGTPHQPFRRRVVAFVAA